MAHWQSSPSFNSLPNESTSSKTQIYQSEPIFTFTSNLDPSLAMTSTFSNSMDNQLAEFSSIFSDSLFSYQAPVDLTNAGDRTSFNRPDQIQSTNPPTHCVDDLSFTGSWIDLSIAAPSLPSTLFTSDKQARGPQREIVEDKTHCSSCSKSKPQ
ncbi:hypothetical protein N7540_012026 [Penicillium herquei]|nr:hypothetical protein N7540_012026 [Penicillium herquei]